MRRGAVMGIGALLLAACGALAAQPYILINGDDAYYGPTYYVNGYYVGEPPLPAVEVYGPPAIEQEEVWEREEVTNSQHSSQVGCLLIAQANLEGPEEVPAASGAEPGPEENLLPPEQVNENSVQWVNTVEQSPNEEVVPPESGVEDEESEIPPGESSAAETISMPAGTDAAGSS